MSSTAYAKYHSTSLSSSTESEALRIGDPEITDWIPVVTGMTHPVSPSTESKALRIGDPEITDWIPVVTGMTHPVSSSTESEALRIGDPHSFLSSRT